MYYNLSDRTSGTSRHLARADIWPEQVRADIWSVTRGNLVEIKSESHMPDVRDNVQCSALRKSVSDPSDLRPKSLKELDRCFSLLAALGRRVESAESLVRKMPGNCKFCHGPTGSLHVGSKWGYSNCKLSHSHLCAGGVTAIPDTRMACPPGYVQGLVLAYPVDPREETSDSSTEVSDQHTSQLESETAFEEDDNQKKHVVEKLVAPLIDLAFGSSEGVSSSSKSDGSTTVASTTTTSVSWSNASLLSSASQSSSMIADPNLFIQQQLEQMKKQQIMQMEKDQERDRELLLLKKQLDEAKKVSVEPRNKSSRTVSFSTGASSGGELADQAAKLAAKARRKAKKKVNDIGVDMDEIRDSPGLHGKVDQFMQSVNSIPSLSLGNKPPVPTHHLDSSLQQAAYSSDAASAGDNSAIAALMAQQQAMMTNQMKMFMEFQQQQELARQQQQTQVQALLEKFQQQPRSSPSSAEKRAERSTQEKLANERRKAKHDSMKDKKKKCDDEYEAALKKLELARRAKKKAEKMLTGATDSDSSDVDEIRQSHSPNKTQRNLLSQFVSSPNSEDDAERKQRKTDKKKKQQEKKLSHQSSLGVGQSLHSAPVPRSSKQGKKDDDQENEKLLSVADWAKLCPVKSASTCTPKNINLPMWVWGKLAEMRAAISGKIQPLAEGELEARLRHVQCVLEVCNQNSTPTEFTPYGWKLARNYDARVQDMIDTKVSDWVSFNSCFSMGPHPSFFLSAMNEVEKTKKKEEEPKDTKNRRTAKCTTFNTCKTKKRCDFEVNNPSGARCKKLHECSFCWKNRQESVFHQWWDCGHGGRETFSAENQ